MKTDSPIQIYQTEDGRTQIDVRFEQDTVWLSQAQMALLFDKDVRTVNEHIKNIFKEGELPEEATIRNFRIVRQEGKRRVNRDIEHYNLDMAISVGYRVNSKKGAQFRIWATQRLKEHLVQGYSLNEQRFDKNVAELQQALALIRKAPRSPAISAEAGSGPVEIISRYTQTFLWLQRYDEGLVSRTTVQPG